MAGTTAPWKFCDILGWQRGGIPSSAEFTFHYCLGTWTFNSGPIPKYKLILSGRGKILRKPASLAVLSMMLVFIWEASRRGPWKGARGLTTCLMVTVLCPGLNSVLQKLAQVCLERVNMTLFVNRIFTDVIKLSWGHIGLVWALNPTWLVPL